MTFAEQITEFVGSASGVAVALAMLGVGAASILGIGAHNTDQFLDARKWVEAFNECLRSF